MTLFYSYPSSRLCHHGSIGDRAFYIRFQCHVGTLLQRKTPSHFCGGVFLLVGLMMKFKHIHFNRMSPFCHPNKRTQPSKPYGKPMSLVEMRRIELLYVYAPMHTLSVFQGLSVSDQVLCPSDMDLVSPKLSPKVRSMISAALASSPST